MPCIVGGQEAATGLFGNAAHLRQGLGFLPDVKADHMGGELHPSVRQSLRRGARIWIAGLDPVGNKDDGRRLFGVAQGLGGDDQRIGHRGHSARIERVDDTGDFTGSTCCRRDNGLDIGALAAFAMAIGDKPEMLVRREPGKNVGNDLARDDDLALPVDLAPHGAGSIENQDGSRLLRGIGKRRGGADGKRRQKRQQSGAHADSPTGAAPAPGLRIMRSLILRK